MICKNFSNIKQVTFFLMGCIILKTSIANTIIKEPKIDLEIPNWYNSFEPRCSPMLSGAYEDRNNREQRINYNIGLKTFNCALDLIEKNQKTYDTYKKKFDNGSKETTQTTAIFINKIEDFQYLIKNKNFFIEINEKPRDATNINSTESTPQTTNNSVACTNGEVISDSYFYKSSDPDSNTFNDRIKSPLRAYVIRMKSNNSINTEVDIYGKERFNAKTPVYKINEKFHYFGALGFPVANILYEMPENEVFQLSTLYSSKFSYKKINNIEAREYFTLTDNDKEVINLSFDTNGTPILSFVGSQINIPLKSRIRYSTVDKCNSNQKILKKHLYGVSIFLKGENGVSNQLDLLILIFRDRS